MQENALQGTQISKFSQENEIFLHPLQHMAITNTETGLTNTEHLPNWPVWYGKGLELNRMLHVETDPSLNPDHMCLFMNVDETNPKSSMMHHG